MPVRPLRHLHETERRDPTVFVAIVAVLAVAVWGWSNVVSQLRPAEPPGLRSGPAETRRVATGAGALQTRTPTAAPHLGTPFATPSPLAAEPGTPCPPAAPLPLDGDNVLLSSCPTMPGVRELDASPVPSVPPTLEPTPTGGASATPVATVSPTAQPSSTPSVTPPPPSPTPEPPSPTPEPSPATPPARPPLPEPTATSIPRPAGVVHTVAPGETIAGLARLYGVAVGAIVEANGIEDPGLVRAGARLLIPGATAPLPTAPAATVTRAPPATPTHVPTREPPSPTRPAASPASGSAVAGSIAPERRAAGGRGAPILAWPARGGLSQVFGEEGHTGIDIMANQGDPVLAAANGVATVVLRSDYGYGWRIELDHGGGLTTLYSHLSAFAVEPGDRVARGQIIGYAGSTGFSTGPHLHFEVRLGGTVVDPLTYLP